MSKTPFQHTAETIYQLVVQQLANHGEGADRFEHRWSPTDFATDFAELIEAAHQEAKQQEEAQRLYRFLDHEMWNKAPALRALGKNRDPSPEHLRASLMELSRYIESLWKRSMQPDQQTIGSGEDPVIARMLAQYDQKIKLLERLVKHCEIHSGYKDCGSIHMKSDLLAAYSDIKYHGHLKHHEHHRP